jgi:hypothetical protein
LVTTDTGGGGGDKGANDGNGSDPNGHVEVTTIDRLGEEDGSAAAHV